MISPWIIFILVLFLSYVTGSTPTSIIVGKLTRGIDIRKHGSGNAGGTNVFRVLGWKPALVVVIVDVFKGWLPTAVYALHSVNHINIGDVGILQILCGFFAVLGHTYPIFAGFKGGKGVGTLGGMLIALFPVAIPLCLVVFVITLIVGNPKRNLIEVERKDKETKLLGDVIFVPSYKNKFIFSSL